MLRDVKRYGFSRGCSLRVPGRVSGLVHLNRDGFPAFPSLDSLIWILRRAVMECVQSMLLDPEGQVRFEIGQRLPRDPHRAGWQRGLVRLFRAADGQRCDQRGGIPLGVGRRARSGRQGRVRGGRRASCRARADPVRRSVSLTLAGHRERASAPIEGVGDRHAGVWAGPSGGGYPGPPTPPDQFANSHTVGSGPRVWRMRIGALPAPSARPAGPDGVRGVMGGAERAYGVSQRRPLVLPLADMAQRVPRRR